LGNDRPDLHELPLFSRSSMLGLFDGEFEFVGHPPLERRVAVWIHLTPTGLWGPAALAPRTALPALSGSRAGAGGVDAGPGAGCVGSAGT
jgi:hypothetical protein